jgi:hypothetical protein
MMDDGGKERKERKVLSLFFIQLLHLMLRPLVSDLPDQRAQHKNSVRVRRAR